MSAIGLISALTDWSLKRPVNKPNLHQCGTFSARVLGLTFLADGTDMIDCLEDIPLAGRMLTPADATAHHSANRHAFPAFVAGPENRLVAHTIHDVLRDEPSSTALQSAETPYRLLVLFGSSGVGKSHLAQGLVRHWQSRHGEE
ncbi:MAG: hypothetical protein IT427_06560, partial [Pirellulales bacterium]|nr:hypothetical protein [Pirellulales bacterium]